MGAPWHSPKSSRTSREGAVQRAMAPVRGGGSAPRPLCPALYGFVAGVDGGVLPLSEGGTGSVFDWLGGDFSYSL